MPLGQKLLFPRDLHWERNVYNALDHFIWGKWTWTCANTRIALFKIIQSLWVAQRRRLGGGLKGHSSGAFGNRKWTRCNRGWFLPWILNQMNPTGVKAPSVCCWKAALYIDSFFPTLPAWTDELKPCQSISEVQFYIHTCTLSIHKHTSTFILGIVL